MPKKRISPVLIEASHASTHIPLGIRKHMCISDAGIELDRDRGVNRALMTGTRDDIYKILSFDLARAVCDANRSSDDSSSDGFVKEHTCHDNQVWVDTKSPKHIVEEIRRRHLIPYFDAIKEELKNKDIRAMFCMHTMEAVKPSTSTYGEASSFFGGDDLRPLFTILNNGDHAGNPQNELFPQQGMEFLKDLLMRSINRDFDLRDVRFNPNKLVGFNDPFPGFDPTMRLGGRELIETPQVVLVEVNRDLFDNPKNVPHVQKLVNDMITAMADNSLVQARSIEGLVPEKYAKSET